VGTRSIRLARAAHTPSSGLSQREAGIVDIDLVADFFVARAHEVGEPISNLKVQKLTYYAEAWYLALHDKPLSGAVFEAWVHGPVNPWLYQRFKSNGWKPIPKDIPMPHLASGVRSHLENVWQVYGSFSALDLERMTHAEDPWKTARGGLPADAPCSAPISPEAMRSYYKALLGKAKKS
jgi:uncharacterized phage-associated protein